MATEQPLRRSGDRRGSMRRIQDVNAGNQRQSLDLSSRSSSPHLTSSAGEMRRAVRELIYTVSDRRSKRSVYDPRGYVPAASMPQNNNTRVSIDEAYLEVDEEMMSILAGHAEGRTSASITGFIPENSPKADYGSIENGSESQNETEAKKAGSDSSTLAAFIVQQLTAVTVVALLNMMMAIPFGASYFPVGWKAEGEDFGATDDGDDESDGIQGVFPLSGKQNIGLRMFLFATFVGQLVYTYQSKFSNPIALQMVENVPFMHALAKIVIKHQGYGKDALSTLFFLFGFSSVIVGLTFYALGWLKQGKIVYFFPNHVLVGCIGGIGVFIVITAMEVTTNTTFDIKNPGPAIQNTIFDHWHLLWVILFFEASLRLLLHWTKDPVTGHPRFQLLSPVFYILITPIFYIGMQYVFGISIEEGRDAGYFFPSVDSSSPDVESSTRFLDDPHLWDIFHIVDFSSISWMAVAESTGTMIALAAFRYVISG